MGTVHRILVTAFLAGIGLDEIDVGIFRVLQKLMEQGGSHVLLGLFLGIYGAVEIAALPVDGLLEDNRLARMGGNQAVDEGNQPLLNRLVARIGEGVKDIGIGLHIFQDRGEIGFPLMPKANTCMPVLRMNCMG